MVQAWHLRSTSENGLHRIQQATHGILVEKRTQSPNYSQTTPEWMHHSQLKRNQQISYLLPERCTTMKWLECRRPFKLSDVIKEEVEAKTQEDDEMTSTQLHQVLIQRGYNISICTVMRCKTALGWTFRASVYCQLICEVTKRNI